MSAVSSISDNVGGVKHFSSTRLHALGEERHFALVEGVAFPTVGSLVIHSGQDTRSDPCISSVTTLIMITTSNSSRETGAGCPISFSVLDCTRGFSRFKGVKQPGFQSGNWLSAEQSSEVLKHAGGDTMRAKRDYAMLAMLFGCRFRRSELVGLELDDSQMRQGHWA